MYILAKIAELFTWLFWSMWLRLQKSPNNKRSRPSLLGVCVCVSATVLAVYRCTVWCYCVSRACPYLDRLEKRGAPRNLTSILGFRDHY